MSTGSAGTTPARRRRVLIPTLVVLAILVGAFVIFAGYYSDWLWFVSVDKTSVFTTELLVRIGLFFAFGTVMALVLGAAMWISWHTRPDTVAFTPEQASLERYRTGLERFRRAITIGTAVVIGFFTGLTAAGEWGTYLQWRP